MLLEMMNLADPGDFGGDDAKDRLVLNVSGVKFETYISTLQNIPDTRLAWLTENIDPEPSRRKEYFFDRHPGVFVHILNYYRTGKLHTPTDICGPAFEEELNFWGIDEKQMEPCCWENFTKHREAEVNLRSFEGPGFEDLRVRERKVSTLSFHEGCWIWEHCDRLWRVLDEPHSSKLAKNFSIVSCLIIVLSVMFYCLGTMEKLRKNEIWSQIRNGFDTACMVWFTAEFVLRFAVCPSKKNFIKSIMNWIDFLSVLPSYLISIFGNTWIRNLIIIRLLRLFRFFKLSYGLQVLIHTLKASFYELLLLLLVLLIPVVIFSSLVHTVETALNPQSSHFQSIPETFWWCLITMTTVGYGDLVPNTWAGKMIGGVCAICGVLIVALPISVIGSNFGLYYAHVRARLKLPRKNRQFLTGNLRGLLKQPLSLSSRERDRRTLKRSHLPAIRRKGPPDNCRSKPNPYTRAFLQLTKSNTLDSNSGLSSGLDLKRDIQSPSQLSIDLDENTECLRKSSSVISDEQELCNMYRRRERRQAVLRENCLNSNSSKNDSETSDVGQENENENDEDTGDNMAGYFEESREKVSERKRKSSILRLSGSKNGNSFDEEQRNRYARYREKYMSAIEAQRSVEDIESKDSTIPSGWGTPPKEECVRTSSITSEDKLDVESLHQPNRSFRRRDIKLALHPNRRRAIDAVSSQGGAGSFAEDSDNSDVCSDNDTSPLLTPSDCLPVANGSLKGSFLLQRRPSSVADIELSRRRSFKTGNGSLLKPDTRRISPEKSTHCMSEADLGHSLSQAENNQAPTFKPNIPWESGQSQESRRRTGSFLHPHQGSVHRSLIIQTSIDTLGRAKSDTDVTNSLTTTYVNKLQDIADKRPCASYEKELTIIESGV